MSEKYSTLFDFIATAKDITNAQKNLYSIILAYSNGEGYCYATGLMLMKRMGMGAGNERRFKRHMAALKAKGWIKVEGNTRHRKIFPLKKSISGQNDHQLKKVISGQIGPPLVAKLATNPPPPPYIGIKETKVNRDIEAQANAAPSTYMEKKETQAASKSFVETRVRQRPGFGQAKQQPGGEYLLPAMMSGIAPKPGSARMVEEVKGLLSNKITIGSRRYLMAEEDVCWFFGFSPYVIEEAIQRVCRFSREGSAIRNVVSVIFSQCGEVMRERRQEEAREMGMMRFAGSAMAMA